MIHFLCNGKQQIVADGNPNLRENRILARTIERLDMQPLLYPFEENNSCGVIFVVKGSNKIGQSFADWKKIRIFAM